MFHVSPNIQWFSNYSANVSGRILLGKGQMCRIVGIGQVPIQLPNRNMIILHQVQHVRDPKRSLFSIGMLAKDK